MFLHKPYKALYRMDLIANYESEETFSENNNQSELKVLTSAISLFNYLYSSRSIKVSYT